jgi:hypothetical protein
MANLPLSSERTPRWSTEALALASQAKVLSGNKLEQLVVRLQRHTGRTREACWRFLIQYGIKGKVDHRRWTDEEVELVREELVKRSVEDVAKKLNRTPMSIRSIRCDLFSIESLAHALHVRKTEIHFWIEQGWLQADVNAKGKRSSYIITAEGLSRAYKHHLADLLKRGLRSQSLFEAYLEFVHAPKHTIGEQLLNVRRDKRERTAFAQTQENSSMDEAEEDEGDENEDAFHLNLDRDTPFSRGYRCLFGVMSATDAEPK